MGVNEVSSEEETLRAAVNDAERLGRLNHRRLDALIALADYYSQRGRLRDAEPLWVKALSLQEKIYGPEHQKLAAPLVDLSTHYERMGRLAEAEAVLLLALKIHERDAVENSARVADDLMGLARLAERRDPGAGIDPRVARAFNIARIVHGDDGPAMARFLLAQGELLGMAGRYDQARADILKATDIFHRVVGDRHDHTIDAWARMGHLEKAQNRFREAETLYRRVLAAHLRAEGENGRAVGADFFHLGELHRAEGKPTAAIKMVRRSLDIREKCLGARHPDVAEAVEVLAECHVLLRHFEEAETGFLRAWDVYEKTLGPDAPGLLRTQTGLAGLYLDRGCYEEADRLLAQLTQTNERIYGSRHPAVRTALMNQIVSFEARDRTDEAHTIRQRLLELKNARACDKINWTFG